MSVSMRKSLMLSPFTDALANTLSSRQKPHLKPPGSYPTTSRPANSVKVQHGGTDLRLVLFCTGRIRQYVSTKTKPNRRNISRTDKRRTCSRILCTQFKRYVQSRPNRTSNRTDLTYDQYINLLISAVSMYDTQFAPMTPFAARGSPRRAVYSYDVTGSNYNDGPDYDIDSSVHSTSSRPMGIRLVHLAPACNLPSGHNCLRIQTTFGQPPRRGKGHHTRS
jgi:hypothetical protein